MPSIFAPAKILQIIKTCDVTVSLAQLTSVFGPPWNIHTTLWDVSGVLQVEVSTPGG